MKSNLMVDDARLTSPMLDAPVLTSPGEMGWTGLNRKHDRPSVYLYPGSIYVSLHPCSITAILGSCVAVCLWDIALAVGGANHFLLPYQPVDQTPSGRFGDVAVQRLIARMLTLGCRRHNLQAKIFGGANVSKAFRGTGDLLGAQNVQAGIELLTQAGIPVVMHNVGGHSGRKLIFHADSGQTWVKKF
jgi:chemotaxis protein CheD